MSNYRPFPNPSEGWIIVEQENEEADEVELYLYDPVYDKKVYIAEYDQQPGGQPGGGHAWTERDGEILEPVVNLSDRLSMDESLGFSFEMVYITDKETVCRQCHMATPRMYNDCQTCDSPLESNVR
jgi:hypothetical protein